MPDKSEPTNPSSGEGGSTSRRAVSEAAAEWFSRRDAGLDAEEEQAFHRWLDAEPGNRAAFARFDSAWVAFGKPSRAAAADDLLEELASRAARRRRRAMGTGAVTLSILVAAAGFWRMPDRSTSRSDQRPVATATLLVPSTRVLGDGTVVTLKNGAEVVELFTPTLRRVELRQGEAMFEVAKNPARPFVVSMRGVEVRAVGTAFSVQVADDGVEVLVTEGTVAVAREPKAPQTTSAAAQSVGLAPAAAPVEAGRVLVGAGKRVVMKTTADVSDALAPNVAPMAAAELDERLAWRNPRVEFSGTPLAEAIALLNRVAPALSPVRLVIDDPALGAIRVSGIFRTDNTDGFVLLLEAGFGVRATRSDRTIRLSTASAGSRN